MNKKTKFSKNLMAQALLIASAGVVGGTHAFEIEEVVVTAQKRAESLQDVPVSVSAMSADELEGLKLRDTTEIASQVPNMQISTPMGDSMPVISLRGISMDDLSLNQSSPVAIYVDEVFKGNPALQSVQMFDLERLEVLRGPQGTLYGKNTTGGAVNFITKKPGFEDAGYLTVGYGNYERKEIQGAYETTLIDDRLAVRAAGTWTERDGWKENKLAGVDDANGIEEWGARVTFVYTPSNELEAVLRLSASESTPDNYSYTVSPGAAGAGAGAYELFNNAAAGLPAFLGVTPPAGAPQTSYVRSAGLDDFDVEEDRVEARNVENTAISLTVNWDLSDQYTLTSITSWDDGEFFSPEGDGTPLSILAIDYAADVTQVAQDLRMTSDLEGPFNFIAGAYYAEEEVEAPVNIPLFTDVDFNVDGVLNWEDCAEPLAVALGAGALTPEGAATEAVLGGLGLSLADFAGSGCQLRNSYEQTRTSVAAYFDGRYDLSDAMTLRFGIRYTEDETELDDYEASYYGSDNVNVSQLLAAQPNISQATLPEDSFTDREWSGKLGLDYTLEGGTLLYTSYSRGYRSGAFNGQAFNDPSETVPVDPEILDAFEVGFKSELLDNRLRLNGAAFYYGYTNQQFLDIDEATATQRLVNIDSSEITGLELELTAALTENLMLRSGLGWLDTEVEEGVVKGENLAGNDLVQAPELSFNLALDYDLPLGDAGIMNFHADTNWVDDQFFDIQNTALIAQEDYWVSNARLSFNSADDFYSVALWVKNIEDKVYTTKPFDLSDFGMVASHIGTPRTAGVELTLRF